MIGMMLLAAETGRAASMTATRAAAMQVVRVIRIVLPA